MNKSILLFFIIFTHQAFCQKTFRLEGEVSNKMESQLVLTIYKNWIEEPADYYVNIDSKNKFYFEIALNELAYIDLNYGADGFLFWNAEPNDHIHISFDALNFNDTFLAKGTESEKWNCNLAFKKRFEIEKDWEYEIAQCLNLPSDAFHAKVDSLENAQLNFLDVYKNKVSFAFFSLKRADIIGKIEQYRLDYALNQGQGAEELIRNFKNNQLNEETEEISFEYGNFIESFLEALKMNTAEPIKMNYDELSFYKNCFNNDYVKRKILERILTSRLLGYLEADGMTSETELLIGSYKEFVKNPTYTNLVLSKFSKIKSLESGFEAPNFEFIDPMGQAFTLKDLKGKNVYLMVWASTCGPCLVDLKYFDIIHNYFVGKTELQLVNIAVDSNIDYLSIMKDREISGKSLRIDQNNSFLKDYEISYFPTFLLIDKNGRLIDKGMIEPSYDEGRGLIKYLEKILISKSK